MERVTVQRSRNQVLTQVYKLCKVTNSTEAINWLNETEKWPEYQYNAPEHYTTNSD